MRIYPFSSYICCVAFSIILCVGQVLFKFSAQRQSEAAFSLAALFSSPWFLIAVGLYGLSTILWVFILVRLPLTVAYPFTLLGAALVPMAACYLFGETLSTRAWLGFALILVGLYIANSK
jgi:multidrug transporter EmrE-like cation transporter